MESLAWAVGIVVTAFVAALGAWLKVLFGQFLPPTQQVRLAIANAFKTRSPRPEQRFRLVLCWLENDRSGRDTGTVAEAFTGVEGIELVRFYRVVSAAGVADDWRPAMRKGALAVLKKWNADLAVVGSVKNPGKALSLWFVPREGDGTLRRVEQPYELVNVTLQDDFHDHLRAQLTAEALSVAARLAETEMRGRVLETGLNGVTEKIAALLEGGAVESARRASLHVALGNALVILGEREGGTARLEQAVAACTKAVRLEFSIFSLHPGLRPRGVAPDVGPTLSRDGRRPSPQEGAVFTREALGSTSSSWSRELGELDARAQVWIRANAPRFSAGASGLSIMSAHVSQRSIDSRLGGTISAMVIGARRRGPGQAAD